MFSSLFSRNQEGLERKNYSRLSIISDFHYPCKKLVTPKERLRYMAAKEGALQDMNDWRDLDLAVFTGDMSSATATPKNTAWCGSSSTVSKSARPSLPAIMNCSIRPRRRLRPAAVPNESCILPLYQDLRAAVLRQRTAGVSPGLPVAGHGYRRRCRRIIPSAADLARPDPGRPPSDADDHLLSRSLRKYSRSRKEWRQPADTAQFRPTGSRHPPHFGPPPPGPPVGIGTHPYHARRCDLHGRSELL